MASQAWVDSLDEDWVSQPRSESSFSRGEIQPPPQGTINSLLSSSGGRPLHERNYSSVNSSSTTNHRRSSLSDGGTVENHGRAQKETPEWKRAVLGELEGKGGKNLFSPMHLESLFRPPTLGPSSAPPATAPASSPPSASRLRNRKSKLPLLHSTSFPPTLSTLQEESKSEEAAPDARPAAGPRRNTTGSGPRPPILRSLIRPGLVHRRTGSNSSSASPEANVKGKRKAERYADVEHDTRSNIILPNSQPRSQPGSLRMKKPSGRWSKGHNRSSSDVDIKNNEIISPVLVERLSALGSSVRSPTVPESASAMPEPQSLPKPRQTAEENERTDTLAELNSEVRNRGSFHRRYQTQEPESSVYPSSPPSMGCGYQYDVPGNEVDNEVTDFEDEMDDSQAQLGSPFTSPAKAPPTPRSPPKGVASSLVNPAKAVVLKENQPLPPAAESTILHNIRQHKEAPKSPVKSPLKSHRFAPEHERRPSTASSGDDDPFFTPNPFRHVDIPPQTPPQVETEEGEAPRTRSSGSPLKLFHSYYDTFTNDKLRQRLGELENSTLRTEEPGTPEVGSSRSESVEDADFSGGSAVVNRLEKLARKQEKAQSPSRQTKSAIVQYKRVHEEEITTTTTTTVQREIAAPETTTETQRKHRRWGSSEDSELNDGIKGPKSPVKERSPKRLRRSTSGVLSQQRQNLTAQLDNRKIKTSDGTRPRVRSEPEEGSILLSATRRRSRTDSSSVRPSTGRSAKSNAMGRDGTPTPTPKMRKKKVPVMKDADEYVGIKAAKRTPIRSGVRGSRSVEKLVFSGSKGDGMQGESFGMPALPTVESGDESIRKGSVTTLDFLAQAEEVMERIRGIGLKSDGVHSQLGDEEYTEATLPRLKNSTPRPPTRRGSNDANNGDKSVPSIEIQNAEGSDAAPSSIIKTMESINTRQADAKVEEGHSRDSIRTQSSKSSSQSSLEHIAKSPEVLQHHLATKNSGRMTFDENLMAWVKRKRSNATMSVRAEEHEGEADDQVENTQSTEDPFAEIPDLTVNSQEERRALDIARRQWEMMGTITDDERSELWRSSRLPMPMEDEYEEDGLMEDNQGVGSWERSHWNDKSFRTESDSASSQRSVASEVSGVRTERTDTRLTSYGSSGSKASSDERSSRGEKNDVKEQAKEAITEETEDSVVEAPTPVNYAQSYSSPSTNPAARHTRAQSEESSPDVDGFLEHGSLRQPKNSSNKFPNYRGAARRRSSGKTTFMGRPVSRINEEEEPGDGSTLHSDIVNELRRMSLSSVLTPLPTPYKSSLSLPPPSSGRRPEVSFHISPLPDLSLHFVDQSEALVTLELSYVASRRGSKATTKAIEASFSIATENLIKHITDVEPFEPYWDYMKYLKLSDRKIETLHTLNEWCPRIVELDVSGNELGQLSGVPDTVMNLNLRANCFSDDTYFGHLIHLQYLDVSGNNLKSLDALRNLRHLREVKADDNCLESLDGIFSVEGLGVLRARRNKLVNVDLSRAEFCRLTELDLRGNQIENISGLERLTSLVHLNLDQNNLQSLDIPEGVCLNSIRSLKLTQNDFESIDLSCVPNLRTIYIDKNRLVTVAGLSHVKQLDAISVREQRLSSPTGSSPLELDIERMYEARKIYLSGNPISNLDMGVDFLNLQYLELAGCQLSELPRDFSQMFPNLRVLNLNFNAISDLTPIRGIKRLKKLLLAGNRIKSLSNVKRTLARLPSLAYVDLRMNPLTVGFYPATATTESAVVKADEIDDAYVQEPFEICSLDEDADIAFMNKMAVTARLSRRRYELTIDSVCQRLKMLDGGEFSAEDVRQQDVVWKTMIDKGWLKVDERRDISGTRKKES